MAAELVPFESITVDGDTQMRQDISADLIAALAKAFEADEPVPAIDLFEDEQGKRWVGDGLHRVAACRKAKKKWLLANIHQGSKRDAVLFAAGANHEHDRAGMRRTTADKEHAVKVLLRDKEWGKRSSNWIAEACHVSTNFVEKVRSTVDVHSSGNGNSTRTGKDGKQRTAGQEDTADEPQNGKPKKPPKLGEKPTKAGAEVIDWLHEFKGRFGPLVRFQDDIVREGQGHPDEKCSGEYYAYGRLIKELLACAERWWKKIKTAKKARK